MIQRLLSTLLICALVQIGSVFFVHSVLAQQGFERSTSELGVGIGGVAYKGEVAPHYRFLSNRPALMVFYKKDVSKAVALRGSLLLGRVKAKDEQYEDLPLAQYRNASVKTSLLELAGGIDYNFLNYYDFRRHVRWTPYFTLGLAGTVYNNLTEPRDSDILYPNAESSATYKTRLTLALPIGVGFKYGLSQHWNIGAEFGTRVLLTDSFDNLSKQNEFVMNRYDKDQYFFTGIYLSYTFFKINCPQQD